MDGQMSKPILCVDFDGVIHSYRTPWQGIDQIPDPPVLGALPWLWKATQWFTVVIYSSRSKSMEGTAAMMRWLLEWSERELGPAHPMSRPSLDGYPIKFAHEKPAAFLTIDDRAIEFNGDWSVLDPAALRNFKPWQQRQNPNDRHER